MAGMTINELVSKAYRNALEKGWHSESEGVRGFGELIALCHSELSEALEEYRNGNEITYTYYTQRDNWEKPEGIPSELADVVIRIADMCGHYNINLEKAIIDKMEYNKTRPHRHGGKKI